MTGSRRRPWVLVGLAALVAAVAFGGCGGREPASASEYERQLRETMEELEQSYGSATGAVIGRNADAATRSVGDVVLELRAAQVGLRDAASRLDALEPPPGIAGQHEELVAGVGDMADAIDLLVRAQQLAATKPRRAEQLARQFATDDSFRRVEAAAAAITAAGVDADL